VVAEGGGVDAGGGAAGAERELFGAGEAVADELPVDEVAAVVDGDAGEILKGAANEVKIFADADDTGIGRKTGDDGVLEGFATGGGGQGGKGEPCRAFLFFSSTEKSHMS
jgi:hypothetical protein